MKLSLKSLSGGLFLIAVLSAGCATPFKERFRKIQLGMDKTDVIDELGSPTRTFRFEEQDIWLYNIQEEDTVEAKEVSFKNGFVTYSGEERSHEVYNKPPSSVEEAQDKLNKSLKTKPSPNHQFKDVKEDGTY